MAEGCRATLNLVLILVRFREQVDVVRRVEEPHCHEVHTCFVPEIIRWAGFFHVIA